MPRACAYASFSFMQLQFATTVLFTDRFIGRLEPLARCVRVSVR